MSDLDRKLEDLTNRFTHQFTNDSPLNYIEYREAIKQAFIDAGWVHDTTQVDVGSFSDQDHARLKAAIGKPEVDAKVQRGTSDSFYFAGDMNALKDANGFMTGQEWFDRFNKELGSWSDGAYSNDVTSVVLAARKAGGLE